MDCWDCRCCSTCDLIKVPDWGPPGGDYFVHDCNWACGSAGTCGEEDLDPEDFAFAWEVVRRGDVDEVLRVLKSFPDNIAVNVERGAVQFWSCGKISASLDFDGDISAIIE